MESARIIVNGRFTTQVMTGVQRYAWEVSKRLRPHTHIVSPPGNVTSIMGHLWEQTVLPLLPKKTDILWSPAGCGPIRTANQVITIHDIAQIEHPDWYSPSFARWYAWVTPRLLRRAAHILTVSEFSRHRMIDYYGIDASSITAVPLGVDSRFFISNTETCARILDKYGLPRRFFLTVGSLSPRKNFHRIMSAWTALHQRERSSDIALVVVGDASLRFAPPVTNLAFHNVIFTGYVPDEDLPAIYRAAIAFLYPSLYEGFGLPVLEAMAAGTPVILSHCPAVFEHPEGRMRGGSQAPALVVNPEDVADIVSAMTRIVEDENLRHVLATAGPRFARYYSWGHTAQQTLAVLQRELPVLETPSRERWQA